MIKNKINFAIIIIGFISLLTSLSLHYLGFYSLIETKLYDTRFKLRGPFIDWVSNVVLLEIDDESYRLIPEPYPYPRSNVWARTIRNLHQAGAKVIVFDIQFDSEDHTTRAIKNSLESDCLNCEYVNQDSEFKAAIEFSKNNGTDIILASKIGYESSRIPPEYIVTPNSVIMESDPILGLVDHEVDILDNVSRRYSIFNIIPSNPEKKYLSIGVQSALSFLNFSNNELIINQDLDSDLININGLKIKAFRKEASFLINYYGPISNIYGTFPKYSLSQVIDNFDYDLLDINEDSNWMDMYINPNNSLYQIFGKEKSPFKDKIVIIGSSLKEDHDFKETPFFSYNNQENLTPGLEFHANAIQQMIDGNYIEVPTTSLKLSNESFLSHFIIMLFFVVLVLLISNRFSILISSILISMLVLFWFSFSIGIFLNDQYWIPQYLISLFSNNYYVAKLNPTSISYVIPISFPIGTVLITYGFNLSYNLFNEQKDKNFLKETFGRYISPELIDDMYSNKKMPELGGESGIRTAFFSDIESFSKISEQLSPSELVELLNEFLTEQTDILISNHGTLDKYEGDAILAFFGAPVYYDDHARQAIDTGVELQENLNKLKEKWRMDDNNKWSDDILNMNMRMGICTGEMVIGNMGSRNHMNYTMMGEVVNLASRLESGAKLYGIYFHTTYNTIKEAGLNRYAWRYIDKTIFIGFSDWKQTVEVFGYKDDVSDETLNLIELFHKGLNYFYKQDWVNAKKYFTKSNKLETISHKDDLNPSTIYLSRIKDFQVNPPEKNWEGIFTLNEK